MGTTSARHRAGDWIETYTGRAFWPLDPEPDDVCIEDIAHSLSNQCRFAGHTITFYSVAEHSYLTSLIVPKEFALWGLLHDASEAYLVDLPRPIKYDDNFSSLYRNAEDAVMTAVCQKFGLKMPMPASVKEADNLLVVNEARALMHSKAKIWSWGHDLPKLPWSYFDCWTPSVAEQMFLTKFDLLTEGMGTNDPNRAMRQEASR